MFNSKQSTLFETTTKKTSGSSNAFLSGLQKESAKTLSGNGALKYSTTGNDFVDQFGIMGSYKAPRAIQEIFRDCEVLWAQDPLTATKFSIYLRIITRKTNIIDKGQTSDSQKGGELKHESIVRMLWLYTKSPDTFFANLPLFVSVGSWKDVFEMLRYDLEYHGWEGRVLDWKRMLNFIKSGMASDSQVELIKKYMPQIKARSNCKTLRSQARTMIAKWLATNLFDGSYKDYRKFKSSGSAHVWQQLISQGKFDAIDFDTIHGRALSILSKTKFFENQGLKKKYEDWITSPETKDVKFTGFVHELFKGFSAGTSKGERATIDKQFDTLVQKGSEKDLSTNLIVVRDTSGSMGSTASGTNMSCFNIAKALALYFSEFLEGTFADAWIEFNSTAKLHYWKGDTPTSKWLNDKSGYVGSTNFQSVIDLFVKMKNKGVAESEFPTGILCISDGEFNPGQLGKTNVDSAKSKLKAAGFSKEYVDNFIIVLWNLQSNYYGSTTGKKFETFGDVPNVFYFSGYNASTIAFLTDEIKNASELFDEAMAQEVLQLVKLA